ncbi:MAG: PaaI family thioesterase [Thermocrispum sp.]
MTVGMLGPYEILPEYEADQLVLRMGIELRECTPERVVGTMPVGPNRQPMGLLHGGANAVLAETLGSVAARLHAGPAGTAVGLDLSCSHHRAVRSGSVTGVCTPLHPGSTTATYEIAVFDEHGNRTCTARLTCAIKRRRTGS